LKNPLGAEAHVIFSLGFMLELQLPSAFGNGLLSDEFHLLSQDFPTPFVAFVVLLFCSAQPIAQQLQSWLTAAAMVGTL
jgi:hypothetical protein